MLLPLRSLYEATGAVDITVNLVGVSASPAIGIGTVGVTVIASGVATTPAIGTGTVAASFTASGVAASAAVGVTRIDVTTTLGSVSATPVIGTGTVAIQGGAVDVIVSLTGVAASPQIGTGTVQIGSVVVTPPVEELVIGGCRWYGRLEDEFVYLTGVAANPRVGKGTLVDFATLYPFPRLRVVPRPPRRIAALASKPEITEKAVPETIIVRMTGVQSMSVIGKGTLKRVYDLSDEEMIALLEAA
jgi:hypothetical protein